jgi:REP element-mobilizing transposase RayT
LNDFGEIVQQEWEQTAIIRPNVELGTFIVMPNHLHGILIFTDDGVHTVGATRRIPPTTKTTLQSGSLGAVMAQFKSIVTKRINVLRNMSRISVWQRNYYEHIIRNEREMDRIHLYIESNPSRWADDDDNPTNIKL